jgi:PhzF family phenazine biosynthesis protein
MIGRRFVQCDVFTSLPTKGNGLAVVIDGDGLSDELMQSFAAWTNLAETTFLMPPTNSEADYKVRIFTPAREMLFAGHPTLGSCAAWLRSGGRPQVQSAVKQECGIGIIDIDLSGSIPAFAAPQTTIEPLAEDKFEAIVSALSLTPDRILHRAQLSNGPVWQVIELTSAADVLAADSKKIRYPEFIGVGLMGAHPTGSECDYEVRALGTSSGMSEDPITGSLNAAIAKWKYGSGEWQSPLTLAQGTCIGRSGRVSIRYDSNADTVWIGGQTCFLIDGILNL